MLEETKIRLLSIHSSGKFAALESEATLSLYHECKRYLEVAFQSLLFANKKDFYDLTELQFYLALITGHDTDAKLMLERLADQFGLSTISQRITVLRSIYLEATAGAQTAIEYLESVGNFDMKADVIRRRTYLASKTGDSADYVDALIEYLDVTPSDCGAWYELSQVYLSLGNYTKAIYSLQQILLAVPFAYNIYYALGTVYHAYSCKIIGDLGSGSHNGARASIDEFHTNHEFALKHFLKSVELCESYSKGWGGVYVLTKPFNSKNKLLLNKMEPHKVEHEKLHSLAQTKLTEIVKQRWTNADDRKAIESVLSS